MKEVLGNMKNIKDKRMCWQDGRLFEDKEDWVVDSCTKCTCQVRGSVTYDECKRKSKWHSAVPSTLSLYLTALSRRNQRLCAIKSHVLQWPVPAPLS